MRAARFVFVGAAMLSAWGIERPAEGHGGGLDGTGGHHCRQAGYDSGKCSPLNSYHCHQSPCGDSAPAATSPPTTAAARPTTTQAPRATTTTAPPATTTTSTSTTTTSTTTSTTTTTTPTTTTTVLSDARTIADEEKADEASPAAVAFTLALLGGLGFGGYRLVKRRTGRSAA